MEIYLYFAWFLDTESTEVVEIHSHEKQEYTVSTFHSQHHGETREIVVDQNELNNTTGKGISDKFHRSFVSGSKSHKILETKLPIMKISSGLIFLQLVIRFVLVIFLQLLLRSRRLPAKA